MVATDIELMALGKRRGNCDFAISETAYLLLITTAFSLLSAILAIEIWVLPVKFIEYGLAISLFTSSIFLVLTIVFLSLLLTIREKREWKRIHKIVYEQIQSTIESLFDSILTNVEHGTEIRIKITRDRLDQDKGDQNAGKLYFHQLELLTMLKPRPWGGAEFLSMDNEWFNESFNLNLQKIKDIQLRYPKLPTEVIEFLVRISQEIEGIKNVH